LSFPNRWLERCTEGTFYVFTVDTEILTQIAREFYCFKLAGGQPVKVILKGARSFSFRNKEITFGGKTPVRLAS